MYQSNIQETASLVLLKCRSVSTLGARGLRYNIYNKRVLNILPMPWLMASAQLGIGLLYVFPLWLTKLRKAPKLAEGSLGPLRYVYTRNAPSRRFHL